MIGFSNQPTRPFRDSFEHHQNSFEHMEIFCQRQTPLTGKFQKVILLFAVRCLPYLLLLRSRSLLRELREQLERRHHAHSWIRIYWFIDFSNRTTQPIHVSIVYFCLVNTFNAETAWNCIYPGFKYFRGISFPCEIKSQSSVRFVRVSTVPLMPAV